MITSRLFRLNLITRFLIAAFLNSPDILVAQSATSCIPCLQQGISFTTQSQIDNFQINYPNCTQIEGSVEISGNGIYNLNGLGCITSIGGALKIFSTVNLTDLTGLNSLTILPSHLIIEHNHGLTTLTGLDNLVEVSDGLEISNNPQLCNLLGLSNLTIIGNFCNLNGNIALINFEGLDNLNSVGFDFSIYGNFALENLLGLTRLKSVGRHLFIEQNSSLICLNGLDSLTTISGALFIRHNTKLGNLTGLGALTSIGDKLEITYNDSLHNLTGLNNLTSIGSYIHISGNPVLTNLSGLSNVTQIDGQINVRNNPSLTSLSGLDNIEAGSINKLVIYDNDLLSECAISSICEYLANSTGIDEIWGNAIGCSSIEEIKDSCGITDVHNIDRESYLTFYPNPASTTITIVTSARNSFYLHTINGQLLLHLKTSDLKTTLDVRNLPGGIYVLRLVGEKGVQVGRFIKE